MKLSEALDLGPGDVVAFVGGGGKTTALRRLGRERTEAGEKVLLLSTTKIEPQADVNTVRVTRAGDLERLEGPWPILAVTEDLGRRLRGVPPHWVDALVGGPFRVCVQADGAARRPFKAPGENEPVIPNASTVVVSLVGMEVVGAPLDDRRVHRPERVAALSECEMGAPVSIEIIASVMEHPDGGGKNVPAKARRVVLLNKVESENAWVHARALGETLGARGLRVLAGSLRSGLIKVVGGPARA